MNNIQLISFTVYVDMITYTAKNVTGDTIYLRYYHYKFNVTFVTSSLDGILYVTYI